MSNWIKEKGNYVRDIRGGMIVTGHDRPAKHDHSEVRHG